MLQVDYLPVGTKADAVDTKFKTKLDDWIALEKHDPGKYLVVLLACDKDYMSQMMKLNQYGFKTVVAYDGENSVSSVVKLQATQSGEMVDWSEVRAAAGGCHLDTEARPVPRRAPPATAATAFKPPVNWEAWEARASTKNNDWGDLRRGSAVPSGGKKGTLAPLFQDPGGDNESAIRLYVEDTLKQWQASPEGSSPGAAIAFTGFQPGTEGQRKRFNFFVHDVAHALNLRHETTREPLGTAINNGLGNYVTVINKPSGSRYEEAATAPPAVATSARALQRNYDPHRVPYVNRADTFDTMRSRAEPGRGYVPRHRRNTDAEQKLLVEQQKKLEAEEMTRQSSASLERAEAELSAVQGELARERSTDSAYLSQPEPKPDVEPEPEPDTALAPQPQTESVSLNGWLSKIKLQQYESVLVEEGYDELQFLCDADADDIDELLEKLVRDKGMKKPHAKTFMKAWKKLSKAQ
jgi:hypothetical protein